MSSFRVRLFPRAWSFSVGSGPSARDLSDLDLAFKVERKTRGALGTSLISLYNPAPETVAAAELGAEIRLRAGYAGDATSTPLIFSGTIRRARAALRGPDRVLEIVGRDGGPRFAEGATFSRAYAGGVRVETVVRDLADALGVGLGNLGAFSLTLRSGASTFANGFAFHGRAVRALGDLLAGAGLRWSVQHGALQVMRRGRPLDGTGELLSPDTGLLETPTWDERGRILTAKALIRPGLEPGNRVRVESSAVAGGSGDFEIRKATWDGDTRGAAWEATIDLRPL